MMQHTAILRIYRKHFLYAATRFASIRHLSTEVTNENRECFVSHVEKDKVKGMYFLNMNRPRSKNAVSMTFLKEFKECLDHFRTDNATRVVILRSLVNAVFCSGADLKERISFTPEQVSNFVNFLQLTFTELSSMPVPTIAAIDGVALGGGLEMSLCCDFRIAGREAKMGLPETKLAIFPGAGGTQRLPRLIGLAQAKKLIYTGCIIDMHKAEAIGLVHEAVPEALPRAIELAKEMLQQGPIAMRLAKKAIDHGSELDIASGLAFEQACYAQLIPTEDRIEGLRAFVEKRKPVYKGK